MLIRATSAFSSTVHLLLCGRFIAAHVYVPGKCQQKKIASASVPAGQLLAKTVVQDLNASGSAPVLWGKPALLSVYPLTKHWQTQRGHTILLQGEVNWPSAWLCPLLCKIIKSKKKYVLGAQLQWLLSTSRAAVQEGTRFITALAFLHQFAINRKQTVWEMPDKWLCEILQPPKKCF